MIHVQLFRGERIVFTPMDIEKDAEIEARWTYDSDYMRMLSIDPVRPLSAAAMKKKNAEIENTAEKKGSLYNFAIRLPAENGEEKLIGFARLYWIEWSNGTGNVLMGIGDPQARGQGYGYEALDMLLRFAFEELNLNRLSAAIPEYNQAALGLFLKAGFSQEIRRREALNRDGRRWDMLGYGILSAEWAARREQIAHGERV